MLAHHGQQHLVGQAQVLLGEARRGSPAGTPPGWPPRAAGGVLGQSRRPPRRPARAPAARMLRLALGRIEHDAGLVHRRAHSPRRGRWSASGDPAGGCRATIAPAAHAGVLKGDHLVAQQRHIPAQRAREGHAAGVPAHALGEAQRRRSRPAAARPAPRWRRGPSSTHHGHHVVLAVDRRASAAPPRPRPGRGQSPAAALVGLPSASKATCAGGPLTTRSWSCWRAPARAPAPPGGAACPARAVLS